MQRIYPLFETPNRRRSFPQHTWDVVLRLLILSALLTAAFLPAPMLAQTDPAAPDETRATISPALVRALRAGTTVPFLVVLREQADVHAILAAQGLLTAPLHQRTAALYAALTEHADIYQAPLRERLDSLGVTYRPYYIANMLLVEGDADLADLLLTLPEVERLVASPTIPALMDRQASTTRSDWLTLDTGPMSSVAGPAVVEPNLSYVRAPDVWAMGYTGQNIVVAGQDTGVQWDHPALKERYRGWDGATSTVDHPYNWFDFWGVRSRPARCETNPAVPCDDNGHGTHTVGTVLGVESGGNPAIGVAPDAQWIACRNMYNGFGTPASYAGCFEFFLAPYPQDGDPFVDGRPDLAPHVINNSWGCPPREGCDADSLRRVVETVRAAGIFVVSSAGNYGPGCSSVEDPIAIYDAAFSVGAHDNGGTITTFSSRGPVTVDGSGRLKPEIAAPGQFIRSAVPQDGYSSFYSGTSMAAPHVVGAAALLWSAAPALIGQIDLTEQVLVKSATPVADTRCGGDDDSIPNGVYGFGRLDALAATNLALAPAAATVTLRSCDATALPGAQVTLLDPYTDFRYTALADANGQARFDQVFAGAPGALDAAEVYSVTVDAGQITFPAAELTLRQGMTGTLTLDAASCAPGGVLTVQVEGEVFPGAAVTTIRRQSDQVQVLPLNSAGQVVFTDLMAGEYAVLVEDSATLFPVTYVDVAAGAAAQVAVAPAAPAPFAGETLYFPTLFGVGPEGVLQTPGR